MEAKLKVLVGSNTGEELRVPGPKFFIGRSEDCHLRPRSDLISRHHCVLILEGSYLGVRDFGSKNGTHVNGERVVGERELKSGDRLKIGPLEFEVVISSQASAPSKKKPKVTSIKEAAERAAETGFDLESSVGDWLTTGNDPALEADTRELTRVDTEEVILGAAPPEQAEEPPPAPEAEAKKPGKLPPPQKAASPYNAAADMLKRLRKR